MPIKIKNEMGGGARNDVFYPPTSTGLIGIKNRRC